MLLDFAKMICSEEWSEAQLLVQPEQKVWGAGRRNCTREGVGAVQEWLMEAMEGVEATRRCNSHHSSV